jgi:GntR family transcriptional regulator
LALIVQSTVAAGRHGAFEPRSFRGAVRSTAVSSKLCARAATAEEAALLPLRDDEDRVVMSAPGRTFAADGAIHDVVDAVYDARRYAWEAEIRRDRGSASLSPTR